MKSLLLAALLLTGCANLPQMNSNDAAAFWMMHQGSVNASQMHMRQQPQLIEPLSQPGSGVSFMCRDALNRRDPSAVMTFC